MFFMLCIWIVKKKKKKMIIMFAVWFVVVLTCFCMVGFLFLKICHFWYAFTGSLGKDFTEVLGVVLMSYLHALKCDWIWLFCFLFLSHLLLSLSLWVSSCSLCAHTSLLPVGEWLVQEQWCLWCQCRTEACMVPVCLISAHSCNYHMLFCQVCLHLWKFLYLGCYCYSMFLL